MFQKVDTDKSGAIDYSEFVVATMSSQKLLSYEKLQRAFRFFDKDSGGTISVEEIQQAINFDGSLSQDDLIQIAKEVDVNGDGEISFDEFAQMMLADLE